MRGASISIVLSCLLVACGESPTNPGDEPPEDTGETPIHDEEQDTSAHVEGSVSDLSGAPVSGANLRFCRGSYCRYETTDDAGSYAFPQAAAEWHALEVVPPSGSGLAVGFIPIELQTDAFRTVDFVLPALDPHSTLPSSPAPLMLGEGLEVTLSVDDLEPPLLYEAASEVAGVRVPEAIWPPLDSLGTAIALWYTVPFNYGAKDDSGFSFRIENLWDLPVGETYQVWVGSYDEAAWLDAGQVTVGADGWLSGEAGLPVLSTVVLVELD